MSRILAIDDDQWRFDGLRRIFRAREAMDVCAPTLNVSADPSYILAELPRCSCVFLDYDLDGLQDIDGGTKPAAPYHKGTGYLDAIVAAQKPVIVVSANYEGSLRLYGKLSAANVQVKLVRATEDEPETKWMGTLWAWGIL